MAGRVLEFSRAHPSTESSYYTIASRLEGRVSRAKEIAAREHEGHLTARGARKQREELRRVLHFQLIRYLVAVGSVAVKDRAELAERFGLPKGNATHLSFVTSARSLLTAADAQKELLVREGMRPTLLEDIARLVDLLEKASTASLSARRSHIGARAELNDLVSEVMSDLRVLDGINRDRFGGSADVLAEWVAAKHIMVSPRQQGESPLTGNELPTADSGGVAPAA